MTSRRKFRKNPDSFVTAVQLNLETDGFRYEKWGETQTAAAGDWLVDNSGETYTIDREVFERTYRSVSPGVYGKTAPVWAEITETAGRIRTKKGVTRYEAGAYLVYDDEEGDEGYAVEAETFEMMYEPSS